MSLLSKIKTLNRIAQRNSLTNFLSRVFDSLCRKNFSYLLFKDFPRLVVRGFNLVCFIYFFIFAGSLQAQTFPAQERVPMGWNISEILNAIEFKPPSDAKVEAKILVWQIIEDDRPLRVENCILWVHVKTVQQKSYWQLANLYRHPVDSKGWHLSQSYEIAQPSTQSPPLIHAPRLPAIKHYDHPPKNKDIYQFLENTAWTFKVSAPWRLIDAAVLTHTWKQIVGKNPTRFYSNIH